VTQVKALFPGEPITVPAAARDVVISAGQRQVRHRQGCRSGHRTVGRGDVVSLLRQREGVASNQVLLRVRFAEVGRRDAGTGGNFFATWVDGSRWFSGTTTGQHNADL
jgi:hypothetical protein